MGTPVETVVALRQAAAVVVQVPEISFGVEEPYTVATNVNGDFEVSPPLPLAGGSIPVTVNYGGSTTSVGTTIPTGFLTLGASSGTFRTLLRRQ